MTDYKQFHKLEEVARKIILGKCDGELQITDLVLASTGLMPHWWILVKKNARRKKNFYTITDGNVRNALRVYGGLPGSVSVLHINKKFFQRTKTGILSKREHDIRFQKILEETFPK